MKNILDFADFINESLEHEDLEAINEGLLSNLFGALLGKDMWSSVNGDSEIKREFSDIDKTLTGFKFTKIKSPNASQNIRQILVDWAGDIYKEKKNTYEKTKELKDVLTSLTDNSTDDEKKKAKDLSKEVKEMNDKISKINQNYEKQIDDSTSDDDLKRWANLLKSNMDRITDQVIDGKYDKGKEYGDDLKKAKEKSARELKEKNKRETKRENEMLEEVKNERINVLKKANVKKLFNYDKMGNEFLDSIKPKIERLMTGISGEEVDLEKVKSSDIEDYIGIDADKLSSEITDFNKVLYRVLKSTKEIVLDDIDNTFKKGLEETSGNSMQAMLSSYIKLLIFCYSNKVGDINNQNDIGRGNLEMMARCCLTKYPKVSFGLPYSDNDRDVEETDDILTMFPYYVMITINEFKKSSSKQEEKDCAESLEKVKDYIIERGKRINKKEERIEKSKKSNEDSD